MRLFSKWVFSLAVILLLVGCDLNEPEDKATTSLSQTKETATPMVIQATEPAVTDQDDSDRDDVRVADADVLHVRAVQANDDSWTFHVTVHHPDTGWEDYADGWDVVTDQGEVLTKSSGDRFTRLLLHPHENEQPFTRNQGGVVVPEGVNSLRVRAHDIVDGFGGMEVTIDLSVASGSNFEVEKK